MTVLVLVVVFVVMPLVELYVFVQTSQAIGFGVSLALLVAVTIVGFWLVRHQGLRVWRRFNEQVAQGVVPSKEIADAVLLLLAGALLLLPGFVSDFFGLLLLLPPTRAVVRAVGSNRIKSRTQVITTTYDRVRRPGDSVIDVVPRDDHDAG